jgi:hypothetical protein
MTMGKQVHINLSCPRCQTPFSASANVVDELILFDEPNTMLVMAGPLRTKAIKAMKAGGMNNKEIGKIFDISGDRIRQIQKAELKKRGET